MVVVFIKETKSPARGGTFKEVIQAVLMRGVHIYHLQFKVVQCDKLGQIGVHVTVLHHFNGLLAHGGILILQLVHGV